MKKYIFTIAIFSLLTACSTEKKQENTTQINENNISEEKAKEDVIVIDEAQFKINEMKLGTPEYIDFPQYIEVSGMIDVPPKNKASISPIMGGYVQSFNLLEGDYVKKGQVLFSLKNPDFVQMQEQFLETKNSLDYLKSDYERQKQLKEEQITSAKKYLKAKSDYQSAVSRYQSLRKQLQMLNINPDRLTSSTIRSTVYITSPLSGYVTDINIEKGIYLESAQVAMKVVNTEHKHVEMKVYEKDLQKIKTGQVFVFYQPDFPQKIYEGKIHLIGKSIDPKQRTVNVHGHLKNEKSATNLLPGVFVTAQIATNKHKALVVPETAIVDDGEKQYVLLLQKDEGKKFNFIPIEVKTGKSWKGKIEILNLHALPKQAKILVKGGYYLIGAGGGEE